MANTFKVQPKNKAVQNAVFRSGTGIKKSNGSRKITENKPTAHAKVIASKRFRLLLTRTSCNDCKKATKNP